MSGNSLCPFLSFKRRTDGLVEPTPGIVAAAGGGGLTFTPGYYTSTSWDGDAKNGASGIIDLSAVFGLPAGVAAVAVRFAVRDEGTGVIASLSPDSTTTKGIFVRTTVAGMNCDVAGVVPCNGNGDVYFTQNGEFDAVYLYILGYWS